MNDVAPGSGDPLNAVAPATAPSANTGLPPSDDESAGTPDPKLKAKNAKIAKDLFVRMTASRAEIKDFLPQWQSNVEQRLGIASTLSTPGVQTETGDRKAELNPDWSLTKTKTANLYSQVPTVQGTHENVQYAAAVPLFMKSVNYELSEKRTNVGVAMNECLNDVVNASGIAGMIVGYAARFIDKQIPTQDTSLMSPQERAAAQANGALQSAVVPQMTDQRFFMTRISPKDLLKPKEFVGSNFDDAAWIGMRGRKSKSEAKSDWKLTDAELEKLGTGAQQSPTDLLTVPMGNADGTTAAMIDDSVEYEEVYYWRYKVDPDEPSFCAIWKLVRVVGRDEPVVHEPWRGQQYLQSGQFIGSKRFPIRILTLTYVSDNAIPPSDTEAGYPQVMDLRRSRFQMFENRKYSIPMRWYDVNRLDPVVAEAFKKGEYQGALPTNGDGSRAMGELARASYPSEDLTFDRNTKMDLQETWQLGPNQMGSVAGGGTTKGESNIVQQNFATRIGQERAAVAAFFLGAVEVLAGWMCLYSDFPILSDQQKATMEQAWNQKAILHDLVLKIRPDSTIVLEVNQQLDRIFKFINMTAKSGYVNVKPLLVQAAELSGIDPTEVIVDPQPPKSDDPNISYRFTGKDDMTNPMVLAILQKRGELPSYQDIQAVITLQKQMLQLSQAALSAPTPAGPDGVPPPTPDGPQGPSSAPASPAPPPPPGGPAPMNPAAPDAHPNWHIASTVAKRQRDI